MMNQNELTIRTYMGIMAERDAAIQERNMALEERKRAFAERDMAMLQRDAAIAECNSVIQERDEAIAALSLQENEKIMTLVDTTSRVQQQMTQMIASEVDDYTYDFTQVASETVKPRKVKQRKESKTAKFPRAGKIGRAEGSRKPSFSPVSTDWNSDDDASDDDIKTDTWKDNVRWGNEIKFDESVMPAPVCTCTGSPQPCYRWGNGGWQSACCTTTISMYPLPQLSNKRYTRVGGRKMSGSAFTKLLNRLASEEGYNLSNPLDLKDHWSKHGTNRYSTVK